MVRPCSALVATEAGNWALSQFANAPLPDGRLKKDLSIWRL